jgi:hypothetical protein
MHIYMKLRISSRIKKKLISLITNKLWIFFATLGDPVYTGYLTSDNEPDVI